MPTGEETEPDSKLAACDKSFKTQLCYELRGIGIYKENHILICHSSGDGHNTFGRLRANFVLARPRDLEAQRHGADYLPTD